MNWLDPFADSFEDGPQKPTAPSWIETALEKFQKPLADEGMEVDFTTRAFTNQQAREELLDKGITPPGEAGGPSAPRPTLEALEKTAFPRTRSSPNLPGQLAPMQRTTPTLRVTHPPQPGDVDGPFTRLLDVHHTGEGPVLGEEVDGELVGLSQFERTGADYTPARRIVREQMEDRRGSGTDLRQAISERLNPWESWMGSTDEPPAVVEPKQAFHDPSKRTLSDPSFVEYMGKAALTGARGSQGVVEGITGVDIDRLTGMNVTPGGEVDVGRRIGRTLAETPGAIFDKTGEFVEETVGTGTTGASERLDFDEVFWEKPSEDWFSKGSGKIGGEISSFMTAPIHIGRIGWKYLTGEGTTEERLDHLTEFAKTIGAESLRSAYRTLVNPEAAWEHGPLEHATNIAVLKMPLMRGMRTAADVRAASKTTRGGAAPDIRSLHAIKQSTEAELAKLVSKDVWNPGTEIRLGRELRHVDDAIRSSQGYHAAIDVVDTVLDIGSGNLFGVANLTTMALRRRVLGPGEMWDRKRAVPLGKHGERYEAGRGGERYYKLSLTDRLRDDAQALYRETMGNVRRDEASLIAAATAVPAKHRPLARQFLMMEHALNDATPFFSATDDLNLVRLDKEGGNYVVSEQGDALLAAADEIAMRDKAVRFAEISVAQAQREAFPQASASTAIGDLAESLGPALPGKKPAGIPELSRANEVLDMARARLEEARVGVEFRNSVVPQLELANRYARPIAGIVNRITERGKAVGMYYAPERLLDVYWPNMYVKAKRVEKTVLDRMGNRHLQESQTIAKDLAASAKGSALLRRQRRADARTWLADRVARQEADIGRKLMPHEKRLADLDNPYRIEKAEATWGMVSHLHKEAMKGVAELAWDTSMFELYDRISKSSLALDDAAFAKLPKESRAGWIRVTEKDLHPGMQGTPRRYGALAGRWVQEDVILEMVNAQRFKEAAAHIMGVWNTRWKVAHTAWSPSTTARNLWTNVLVFAPMAGIGLLNPGNWGYYARAVSDLLVPFEKRSKEFRDAWQDGSLQGTLSRTELGGNRDLLPMRGAFVNATEPLVRLGALVEAITTGKTKVTLGDYTKAGRLKASAAQAIHVPKSVLKMPGKLYGALDDVFRLALYYQKRDQGMLRPDAAALSRMAFVDYENVPGWVQTLRAPFIPVTAPKRIGVEGGLTGGDRVGANALYTLVGQPFIAFPSRAIPLVTNWLKQNPIEAQMWLAIHDYMSDANAAESGGPDAEALRAFMEATPFYLRNRYQPAAFIHPDLAKGPAEQTAEGLEEGIGMFNTSFWNVFEQVTPQTTWHQSPIDQAMGFLKQHVAGAGSPLIGPIMQLILNEDAFLGREIRTEGATPQFQTSQMLSWLLQQWLPPIAPGLTDVVPGLEEKFGARLPGGYQWEKLQSSETGRPDYRGRVRPFWQTASDVWGGIRIESMPVSTALEKVSRDFASTYQKIQRATLGQEPRALVEANDATRAHWEERVVKQTLPSVRKLKRTIRGLKDSPAYGDVLDDIDSFLSIHDEWKAGRLTIEDVADHLAMIVQTARSIVQSGRSARNEALGDMAD